MSKHSLVFQNLRLAASAFEMAVRTQGIERLTLLQGGSSQAANAYIAYIVDVCQQNGVLFSGTPTLAEVEARLSSFESSNSEHSTHIDSILKHEGGYFLTDGSAPSFFKDVLSSHQETLSDWQQRASSAEQVNANLIASSGIDRVKHWTQYSDEIYLENFTSLRFYLENRIDQSGEY